MSSEPDERELMEIIKSSVVNLETSRLKPDSSLRDLGMDSMDKMNLLLSLEQRYGIKISDEEAQYLDSLSAITQFISTRT